MDRAYELARYPFLESDYQLTDQDGRTIDHLLAGRRHGIHLLGGPPITVGDDH